MKILIVDDNVHDREAIFFFLKSNGYEDIITAANGKECIEQAVSQKPQVVILDLILPDIKGYGICKALKSAPGLNCTVILLTGKFHQYNSGSASEAQPDFFLAKTTSHVPLLNILNSIKP